MDESDLSHREMPVSATYHHLVMVLASKLEATRLYGTYEQHARAEGKEDVASLFVRIASRDRHSIEELMQSLRAQQDAERTAELHSIFAAD